MVNLKSNDGKPLWSLLPMPATEEVVNVFTYGSIKYGPNNWREEVDPHTKDLSAALRHICKYQSGEKYDKETNINHLAHAAADLLIVITRDLEVNDEK
jgi:hypothetical protein